MAEETILPKGIFLVTVPNRPELTGRIFLGTNEGATNLFKTPRSIRYPKITHVVRLCSAQYRIPEDIKIIQDTEIKEALTENDYYFSKDNKSPRSAYATSNKMWDVLNGNKPNNNKILVHCAAGHNRSVGQIMHYLTHAENLEFDPTYYTVFYSKKSTIPPMHKIGLGIYEHFQREIQGLGRTERKRKYSQTDFFAFGDQPITKKKAAKAKTFTRKEPPQKKLLLKKKKKQQKQQKQH